MDRVEAELNRRAMTLADFARRIGVKGQHINNWKRRGIPRGKQEAVARALGWTLDKLLTGRDTPVDPCPQPGHGTEPYHLSPRHQELIELFDGLIEAQQESVIQDLRAKKSLNDDLLTQLLARRQSD